VILSENLLWSRDIRLSDWCCTNIFQVTFKSSGGDIMYGCQICLDVCIKYIYVGLNFQTYLFI
jgi:hypothetical protein